MKIKQLLTAVAITSALVALNARAATVTFVETGEIDLGITWTPGDWFDGGAGQAYGTEEGLFVGHLSGTSYGSGSWTIGLQEFAGGPVSDLVNVDWGPDGNNTRFGLHFLSDIEGQPLPQPPSGSFDVLALETGALQEFTIPSTAFDLTVRIQSDAPETVPDGGATIVLLGTALSALGFIRRKLA